MNKNIVKIGLTEQHGMSLEQSLFPPKGIEYSFLSYKSNGSKIFTSPMKGYMSKIDEGDVDVIETVMTPIITNKPWFYSLACYQEAVAFSLLGLPIPRAVRLAYMEYFFTRKNFKGFIFWSNAGLTTMKTYGQVKDQKLIDKAHVVYPAVREVDDKKIQYNNNEINILFNGNFFIKGGANVVDAFIELEKIFDNLSLRLLCDEKIDFHTGDKSLKEKYLKVIKSHKKIKLGRAPRETLLNEILPQTDIYVLPTYGDAFGFAVLEAMAYGIPVVSTNYMAIPEMVDHEKSGYLIDISEYNCQKLFKGCYVNKLPDNFKNNINAQLTDYLYKLISSTPLRKEFGQESLRIARSKFSFDRRNEVLGEIYKKALFQN